MSVVSMDKYPFSSIVAKPPKAMGKAKIVFLQPNVSVVTDKVKCLWAIRPTDDSNQKFSLEVGLPSDDPSAEALKNGLTKFDMTIRDLALANKKAWFGKVGDEITSVSDLRTMHTMSVKKGTERIDGSSYDDSAKFKVTGWSEHVEEVIYKSNSDNKWPVDVKWRTRLVDPQGRGGPSDNETRFYICQDTSMTTGKEQMVPWIPCQDPAGNHIKDSSGNTVYEFVGPKHCQPGCKVRVVFNPSMVWLASKFGVTLAAKQVFITPPPVAAKTSIEGIEIKDYVDPILAGRAARAAMSSDVVLDDAPDNADDDEAPALPAAHEAPAPPAVPAAGPAPEESKKKKLDADAGSPKKKAKAAKTIDDEF